MHRTKFIIVFVWIFVRTAVRDSISKKWGLFSITYIFLMYSFLLTYQKIVSA